MNLDKPYRLSRKTVYESRWVNLYLDRVRFPNGHEIEEFHLLDFDTEAVAAIVENDWGQVLLVRPYRYPTDTLEWEIPAGGIEPGEDVLAAARREVWEEAGLETIEYRHIAAYYPMNGNANKRFHLVKANGEAKALGELDENEISAAAWFSRHKVRQMIKSGRITDGYSLTGLLWWLADI